jgi:signal transduction histidine kinase
MRTPVLHDLLVLERSAVLSSCEEKVMHFGGALAAHPPSLGWAMFYDDFIEVLEKPFEFGARSVSPNPSRSVSHADFVVHGYTISEVVQSYGIISQSITQLAQAADYLLSPEEHAQLNMSLGAVIAEAATEFESAMTSARETRESQRLGTLAHELRNSLQAATISLEMIGAGATGANSNTSTALERNLHDMGRLIDTTLTEVRMRTEKESELADVLLIDVISEIATTAGFVARTKNILLVVQGHYDLVVYADRQLLLSALSNIVQNALKYSAAGSTVSIHAVRKVNYIRIEVADQCGGLPADTLENMFRPFTQCSTDRTGIGLGLSISHQAIKRCNGELTVMDVPGVGCIFTVQLPIGKSESLGVLAPPY